ncbi:hypothetical protein ALC62_10146, partial [Cyphomyrmex costatus]
PSWAYANFLISDREWDVQWSPGHVSEWTSFGSMVGNVYSILFSSPIPKRTFWITPANSTRDSQRNSGTGIQDTQSCCKEEQLLWSKSLSPSSPSFSLNNPPFRFNLLHFARIPRRTVMTHHRPSTLRELGQQSTT